MIDINFLRQFPEKVKDSCKKRNMPDRASLVDEVLALDKKWKDEKQKVDQLRQRRNTISLEINEAKKKGKDISKLIKETRELPEKVRAAESHEQHLWEGIKSRLMLIPNVLHDSVPVGKTEADNVVVRTFGKKPKFSFTPLGHAEIGEKLGLVDLQHSAKIAGARWYALKGKLAILEMSLTRYAVDFMTKRGYEFVVPPYMMNRKSYDGVVALETFEEMLFKVDGEDLYLIATSEHPLTAFYQDEVISENELPIKLVGFSTNFRKEAGAHGKDTKGIFRVHQFNKVEQVVICRPEESWKFHEELLRNVQDFFKTLELHFRTIVLCSGDSGLVSAKTYDPQVWFPAQNDYREVGSCSNVVSYQAARSNIRYQKGNERLYVHTLNSTCVATSRALAAILENFQNKDGSITIPKVLRKYTGFDRITVEKKR